MTEDQCAATYPDNGPPLRCRREAGHPGFHSLADDIWWGSREESEKVLRYAREVGVEVVDISDPEAALREAGGGDR